MVSAAKTELVEAMAEQIDVPVRLAFGGAVPGCTSYDEALSTASTEPLADQPHGDDFLYSSGTTGRPKGIKLPLLPIQVDEPGYPYVMIFGALFSYGEDTVYLSPAPVYHAAPLRYTGVIQALGGTRRADAALRAGGVPARGRRSTRVTDTQWCRRCSCGCSSCPRTCGRRTTPRA